MQTLTKAHIRNIFNYENKKFYENYPNDISLVHFIFREDFIYITTAPHRHPVVIMAKWNDLYRLGFAETVCLDKTHSKKLEGVFVLSEKVRYDITREKKRVRGQRCFPRVYVYTRAKDAETISDFLTIIKTKVEQLIGQKWRPKRFIIDFDDDNFFFFNYCFSFYYYLFFY